MTVLEAIKSRFSVRKYQTKPVEEHFIASILEAARFSQSAKNLQNWHFIVVRDATTRRCLMEAAKGQAFVAEAPVVIVCCGTHTEYVLSCGQYGYSLNVAIAMENMALVAHELGLGTCWVGSFYEDRVKECLGIPAEGIRVVGMLTLGYPAVSMPPKNRHPLESIVKYERW